MWLLDTHVWVWAVLGETRRLGRRTRRLLERAERDGTLRVSAVSMFEVVALHTCGRLQLAGPAESWVREASSVAGLRLEYLTGDAAIAAGTIPRGALADPLDRLLVAAAGQSDATLVTADARILDYASAHADVKAHDARL